VKRARIAFFGAVICVAAPVVRADCLDDAARFHHVNVRLVRAVATVESGLHPGAMHVNADGSSDIGLMQINTRWLATLSRFGISRGGLYDGCTNAYVGSWILSQNIRRDGLTWDAVGAYNAGTHEKRIAYARRIYAQLMVASAPVAQTSRPGSLPLQRPGFIARLFMPVTGWEARR
jgi:soluble lytic murein transglycosylase-like protein